jgi:hypothetical protein
MEGSNHGISGLISRISALPDPEKYPTRFLAELPLIHAVVKRTKLL